MIVRKNDGAQDWRLEVIYSVLTDRFSVGGTPFFPTFQSNPVRWHGGNYEGIRDKIQEGYFADLGVTAILISPPMAQVPDVWDERTGLMASPYHAYWPFHLRQPNKRFGSYADLQRLVRTAHIYGVKVVLDIVHHLHRQAPLFQRRPDWFVSEEASAFSEIPVLDLSQREVQDYMLKTIKIWASTGVDAFRWDSMQHFDVAYLRRLFLDSAAASKWSVGEIFNGDPAVIAQWLETGCPAIYDYPLAFAMLESIGKSERSLDRVAQVLQSYQTLGVVPNHLVRFVDNLDVARFRSDVMSAGASPQEATERFEMALRLIFSLPGIPCVYYGTENALGGEGMRSPFGENRLSMDFTSRQPLRGLIASLSQARRSNRALTLGDYRELWRPNSGTQIFAFGRIWDNSKVVVVINNHDYEVQLSDLGGVPTQGLLGSNSLLELTGQSHRLQVHDGRLFGPVPPRTCLLLTNLS